MKIFDSNQNQKWTGRGLALDKKNIIAYKNANFKHKINLNSGNYTLKIFAKNRTGISPLEISILSDDNKILLKKSFSFKRNWTEEQIVFDISKAYVNGSIVISRPPNTYGSIEIGRLILELEIEKGTNTNISTKDIGIDKILINDESAFNKFSKKKIGFIVPYEIFGGAEIFLQRIVNSLENKFFDIHILYMKQNFVQNFITNKFVVHKKISNVENLNNYIVNSYFDFIVYYNSKSIYQELSKIVKENKLFTKLIEIYHSDFIWSDSLSTLGTRDGTDVLFAVSKSLGNNITNVKSKIHLPVPIDINEFCPRSIDKKKALNLPNNNKIIGTVARLSKEKNIDYILDLSKKMIDINFLVFGDGPLKQHLNDRINLEKIKNVYLLGFKKDVSMYYNTFDGFLLTSLMEGTPISILEAMASGVPVFTSDVGSINQIINNGVTGYFINNNLDDDAKLIYDNIDNKTVVENAISFIKSNHDKDKVLEIFTNALLNVQNQFIRRNETPILLGEYV